MAALNLPPTKPVSRSRTLADWAWQHIQADRPALAAAVYEELRFYRPADPALLCNLSYLYERAGLLDDAEDRARLAVRFAPALAEGWNNLGVALREQHRFFEAIAAFERAVVERSDFALARFNCATTQLLAGDYRSSWSGYDQRLLLDECAKRRPALPLWHGESLAGKPLVVYSDQGAGDAIQFARFLPEIRDRAGGPLWFSVPCELQRLFEGVPAIDRFLGEGASCPAGTQAIALGSLPGILDVKHSQLPWREEYLTAPLPLEPALQSRLNDVAHNRRRVGLVWQGNPRQARDYVRSCSLGCLRPLLEVEDVAWFSLQVNASGQQSVPAPRLLRNSRGTDITITDLAPDLRDFADTAAVISELDLVITVDTAVAHLAGALGRPAWVLLCHTPDWRWGIAGDECAWYPSLRLFRQRRRGDWDGVIATVVRELNREAPVRSQPGASTLSAPHFVTQGVISGGPSIRLT